MRGRLLLLGLAATLLLPVWLFAAIAPYAQGLLPAIAQVSAQTTTFTLTLLPSAGSNPVSSNNYFTVHYKLNGIPQTAQYTGTPLQLTVDSGSTVTIDPTSSGSGPSEEWCFALSSGSCVQVSFTPTGGTVTYYYYDLLGFKVSFSVSGGGSGYGAPQLSYVTAPSTPGQTDSPVPVTITLPQSPSTQQIWALRGSGITVSKTLPGSGASQRWATNITSWTAGSPTPPPPGNIVYYNQYLVSVSPSVVYGSLSSSNLAAVSYSAYGGVNTSKLAGPGNVWVDVGGVLGWLVNTSGSGQNVQYSATPFTYGLVGYWPLSEGAGATVFDLSGRGNTGQIVGLPVWVSSASCLLGVCLTFDGSQYVVAKANSIPLGSSAFTKAVWAYLPNGLSASEENRVLVCWGTPAFSGSDNCLVTGSVPNQLSNNFGGTLSLTWTSAHIVNGWNLIVVTYNGSVAQAYVNGFLEASAQIPALFVQPSQVYIGGGVAGYSNFDHPIQEVRVYGYAWSQAQVSQYYASSKQRLESTVAFPSQTFTATYYKEVRESSWYSLVGGGSPAPPTIWFYMLGQRFNQTLTSKPQDIWMDAGAKFNLTNPIPSSSPGERWATNQTDFTPPSSNKLHIYYFHQYALSVGFKVVGGGSGYGAPMFAYVALGQARSATLNVTPAQIWADASTNWSVDQQLSGSTSSERWQGDFGPTGTVNAPATLLFEYYHQFNVQFSYTVVGGGSGYGAPQVVYSAFGSNTSVQAPATVWVDAGTHYQYANPLSGSTSSERWYAPAASGLVSGPESVQTTYYHQFLLSVSYSVVGGGSPPSPGLNVTEFGSTVTLTVQAGGVSVWADSGGLYVLDQYLYAGSYERWASPRPVSGVVASSASVQATYYHQFYVRVEVNVVGAGTVSPASGWYNASATITISAQPAPGWMFEGWSGSGAASYSGNQSQWSLSVSSPIVERAVFYPGLTVYVQAGGSVDYSYGSVSGSFGGGTHTIYVPPGTAVRLSEKPTPILYVAQGFSYSGGSLPANTTITVSGPISVTAAFAPNYPAIAVIALVVVAAIVLVLALLRLRGGPKPP